MIDSSKWRVIEAGAQVPPGQGRRQLDQPQGRRGGVPRQARRVRRYGAAVVVMAFDEQGQADTVERKVAICDPGLPAAHRAGRASRRRTSSSTRTSSPIGTGHRGARRLRRRLHRGHPPDQGDAAPRAGVAAASATSPSPSAATTRCARRSTPSSSTTRSPRAWTWASSTPASCRSTTTSRRTCCERGGGRACSTAAPTRPSGSSPSRTQCQGAQAAARAPDLAWRELAGRASG